MKETMKRQSYSTDLTDKQGETIEPLPYILRHPERIRLKTIWQRRAGKTGRGRRFRPFPAITDATMTPFMRRFSAAGKNW